MATAEVRAQDIGRQVFREISVEEFNRRASKGNEYAAERIIGKGYFGTVFLAKSRSGRRVAIKVAKTGFGYGTLVRRGTSSTIRQAQNEIECLRQLRHPYIIQLLDEYSFTSDVGQGIAIVTEYCAKGNLQQYLQRNRPGVDQRFKWCQQLAEAMKHIHSKAILHRDIKPDNILIDSEDNMRIADVGIAKPAWEVATELMGVEDIPYESYMCSGWVAPPPYMAPEVFNRPRTYHRQSDIFSLGIVFVMIVESPPGELIPYVKYGGVRTVLGKLLHDVPATRSCNPTDLMEMRFTQAYLSEIRLFNKMLAADYHRRPKAYDVLAEINSMNRARGIRIDEVPDSAVAPAPISNSGCCNC